MENLSSNNDIVNYTDEGLPWFEALEEREDEALRLTLQDEEEVGALDSQNAASRFEETCNGELRSKISIDSRMPLVALP